MGKINVLDINLTNMIAAGEVVERPASVIKEIVENSIDAGATAITIEIRKGGISYIRVSDNGSGIEAEDISAAFLPHATSKIRTTKDLEAIFTLGFRGEALASIASVSKLTCTSKTSNEKLGMCAKFEGGCMMDIEECGATNGTSIAVENLFFNTPARMKFLKKDATEASYILDIVARFILSNTKISFKFINSDKQIFYSPGDGILKNAVYCVYGKDYANGLIDINHETQHAKIYGVCGKTNLSRANRSYQSFFINGRFVKSPLLTAAVEQAYKNQLMVGKFPICAINISINPALIDVNVHPSKLEVKFSDEKAVFDAVYWATKNALYASTTIFDVDMSKQSHDIIASTESEKKEFVSVNPTILKDISLPARENISVINNLKSDIVENIDINAHFSGKRTQSHEENEPFNGEGSPDYIASKNTKSVAHSLNDSTKNSYKTSFVENPIGITQESPVQETFDNNVTYKIIGQIFSTYIILEKGNKMLMLDQHAAHERLYFEELKLQHRNRNIASQMLLSPMTINLSPREYAVATDESTLGVFSELGFEIEDFGVNTIAVRMVPIDISHSNIETLIFSLLEEFKNYIPSNIGIIAEKALYMMACKKAIKANTNISSREIEALVHNVFMLDNINTCPHGRPIIIEIDKKEIEKEFKRIV